MAVADLSGVALEELVSLAGRRAVVTGGAQGLGKAIARRLAEAGADVLIADRQAELARAAAADLDARHSGRVIACTLDVADEDSVAAAADHAVVALGGIDIWVNNAGIFPIVPLVEMTTAIWDDVMAINLRGVFLGAQAAARQMIAAGRGGVIVNIASTAGIRAEGPGVVAYASSKFGVRGTTAQLGVELAPHGIRVLGVAPTSCRTEGTHAVLTGDLGSDAARQMQDYMIAKLGRRGEADDVARVVFFCASDLAMFMSGSTLLVDGANLA